MPIIHYAFPSVMCVISGKVCSLDVHDLNRKPTVSVFACEYYFMVVFCSLFGDASVMKILVEFVYSGSADLLHVFSYLPKDLNFIEHTSDIATWKE